MITDILFFVIGSVLGLIQLILGAIDYVLPPQINLAFVHFFGYLRTGDGFFPVSQAILAILAVLTVWLLMYGIKILFWAFSLLPIIGKVTHLPTHSSTSETSTFDKRGNLTGRSKTKRTDR